MVLLGHEGIWAFLVKSQLLVKGQEMAGMAGGQEKPLSSKHTLVSSASDTCTLT